MKNKRTLYKLTHGMYVLSTNGAGCFVDAVCQVGGGDEPLVSVAVMKKNYTNEILHKEKRFAISIFGMNDDPELIKRFGFNSSRDFDKFKDTECEEILGVPVVKNTIGYMVLETIDMIENDTHTVFIAKVIEADQEKNDEPMTYGYYQAHKDELMAVKTENNQTAWVCQICGYIYYGDELPSDYTCPICSVGAENFMKQ